MSQENTNSSEVQCRQFMSHSSSYQNRAECWIKSHKSTKSATIVKSGVLRLGDMDQAKAKGVGKRGRQAMDRHFQEQGGRGACIAHVVLGCVCLMGCWLVSSPNRVADSKRKLSSLF